MTKASKTGYNWKSLEGELNARVIFTGNLNIRGANQFNL
jgi:hypothetical protein